MAAMMHTGHLVAGRYRLEEQVGTGGMGVVWRAHDEKLDRVVALKRSTRGIGADSERIRRRMRREAKIAAGLNHPHVVAFIDDVIEGPERWLVMEYVPSQSLAQILDRSGPLRPQHVTHIGAQIACALEAVHSDGIVHRDVKPGNILITEDGTAKLTDFGISRPIYGDVTMTDTGVISGTVAYLAPEVADGQDATPSSDVFALGATLFAAVEGTPPFGTADNPLLVLRRAAAGDLLPVLRAGPLTPTLSALLQPDPVTRPDATAARRMLQELATTLAQDEGPLRWPVGTVRRPRRFRRRAAAGAAASMAVLGTVAGLLVFRPETPAGAAPALGDPRTADPCALSDSAVLTRFGMTERDSAYGGFNRCDILVTLSSGAQADVAVQFFRHAIPGAGSEPLRVIRQPENDGSCVHTVPLADQNRVQITAKLVRGSAPADLCGMAEAASGFAVAVLGKGVVPQRDRPADGASLARMDACAIVDSAALAPVLGTGISGPSPGFGDWGCRWSSSINELSVHLVFSRNTPLGPEDGRVVTLSGRDTHIMADGPDCLAQVIHRNDVNSRGEAVQELVEISVSGPRLPDQLCGPAQELAAAAAAKLPPSR